MVQDSIGQGHFSNSVKYIYHICTKNSMADCYKLNNPECRQCNEFSSQKDRMFLPCYMEKIRKNDNQILSENMIEFYKKNGFVRKPGYSPNPFAPCS